MEDDLEKKDGLKKKCIQPKNNMEGDLKKMRTYITILKNQPYLAMT
jgi:hypothetical protein